MRRFRSQRIAATGFAMFACTAALIHTDRAQGRELRVHVTFDLSDPDGGPFPSNWFTIADPSQKTRLRVNLPEPDCSARPSDCEDVHIINTLDGFNLLPRLSIPFDGPIDPATVSSRTVVLVSLGSTTADATRAGVVSGINQVVWDPSTNMLHVEADELLDQHTCYALLVTNGIRDLSGLPVEAAASFRQFVRDLRSDPFPGNEPSHVHPERLDCRRDNYPEALAGAFKMARHTRAATGEIVGASLFTTLSATAVLEKIRDQLPSLGVPSASFNLGLAGARTNFALSDISGITLSRQIRVSPPAFSAVVIDLPSLQFFAGAVGGIAYGKYRSPDYLVHSGEYMPPIGTRRGTPAPTAINDIYFDVVYPAGTPPAGGWPVAIYGHGANGNKDEWLARVAGSLAAQGIATVGINTFGTGFGPSAR